MSKAAVQGDASAGTEVPTVQSPAPAAIDESTAQISATNNALEITASGPGATRSEELSRPSLAVYPNIEARPWQQSASRKETPSDASRATKRRKVTASRSEDVRSPIESGASAGTEVTTIQSSAPAAMEEETAQVSELSRPSPAVPSNSEAGPWQKSASRNKTTSGPSCATKRRRVTASRSEDEDEDREDETAQPDKPAPKRRRKPKDLNAPKKKRNRDATPEDAEEQVIDQATVKMADLTKDLRIGKKFSMRDKILRRELERKEQARLEKEKEKEKALVDDSDASGAGGESEQAARNVENTANVEAENGTQVVPDATPNNFENTTVPVSFSSGPKTRVVNGRLVLDEASTQVDRQRQAAENQTAMEVVVQDDFTRLVTAGTHLKKEKSTRWGHFDTEKFYEGLTMFGTDFEMIAKTFGSERTRRQIKLKFNKEERGNPDRVKRCLIGKKEEAMDLSKVKGSSKLEDTDAIKAEIAEKLKQYDDEDERQAAALAESDRQKRARIRAGAGGESSKENESGASAGASAAHPTKPQNVAAKKMNKRAKQQHMGGEDFVVVGNV